MDDQFPESSRHEITLENAILIPALPNVKSVLSYVEAVSVVIGSCHIHSVYEDHEYIKIYLKDKRFVDILVNNGVAILGRQINVDYAVPRADKIIMSNVDPIIPDAILLKLLSFYGNPVSAIIHEKIATSSEYSHIECGKRKVFMNIFADKKVPTKINFTYQSMYFRIDLLVEPFERDEECEPMPSISQDASEEDNDVIDTDSTVNLKPDVQNILSGRQPTPRQLAYRNRGKGNSVANAARRLKRRARKGWYGTRQLNGQTRDKMKLAVKKHLADKGARSLRKLGNLPKPSTSTGVEDDAEISIVDPDDAIDQNSVSASLNGISPPITQYPLSSKELSEFIRKTRFQRDLLQIVWEFLGDNKTPEALEALKFQLLEFLRGCKGPAIKLRIRRIIASLKWPKDANAE